MNRIRIALVGLVALAVLGHTVGGASAATGRGTASSGITLLDVSLENVQQLKVVTDEGQATLDPSRFNLPGPQAFGQLSAVDTTGIVKLALPNLPVRAQAPGTTSAGLNSIPVSVPPSPLQGIGGLPIGAGALASGTVNPVKVEAFSDPDGVRSTVATDVPSLSVLSGLVTINNVKAGGGANSVTSGDSVADSGVLSIGDVTVLDLSSFLGGLGLGLEDLNPTALLGLVSSLGLGVPATGVPGLSDLPNPTDITAILNTVTGLASVLTSVTAAATCSDLAVAGSTLSRLGLEGLLGGPLSPLAGQLRGLLSVDDVLNNCSGAFTSVQETATSTVQGALATLAPTADGLLDSVYGLLDGAPLLSLSGVEISTLARATEALGGSSATASTKLGTLKVGGTAIGALDRDATSDQVNNLATQADSALRGVTSILGLGNLIDVGLLERMTSTKTEGAYNAAEATVSGLRVSINPPADLSSVLAPVTSGSIGSLLAGNPLFPGLPRNVGLADNALASALGLTSLLSRPTTITVGAIRSRSDFTVAATVTPAQSAVARTGTNAAWIAAPAVLAAIGAFLLRRKRSARTR